MLGLESDSKVQTRVICLFMLLSLEKSGSLRVR